MEFVAEQNDIPHYFFLFSTAIQSAIDFAAVSLAFIVAKKKREKERDRLIAEEALRKTENENR